MKKLTISTTKHIANRFKAGCRFLCRPFLFLLPNWLTNFFPFMGRVCIYGPDKLRLHFYTYSSHGKDRIAIKLARRGIWGYEGETTRVFLALARETKTIIDVGANTGLFALMAAHVISNGRVIAFEPVPFIYGMLKSNVRLNKLNNIHVEQIAIADHVGQSSLYVTRTHVGIPTDSSLCHGFRDQVDEYHVVTTTLDEYVNTNGLSKVDLLKIDVEAAEKKVIAGALQTLKRDFPFIICEVLEDIDHDFLQQTLQDLNYIFYHITPADLQKHKKLQGNLDGEKRNYLFVPENKHDLFLKICFENKIIIS